MLHRAGSTDVDTTTVRGTAQRDTPWGFASDTPWGFASDTPWGFTSDTPWGFTADATRS